MPSARLTLEPQVQAHAEAMFAILSDPAIYTYENEPPVSLEWLRERFARLASRRSPDGREQWLNWVIRLPSGELAGFVQATVSSEAEATIAYVLHSAHWGCGLASEAVQAMILELAHAHGVGRLVAVFKQQNHRSRSLLERLGFLFASPALHTEHQVEPDEQLMTRALPSS